MRMALEATSGFEDGRGSRAKEYRQPLEIRKGKKTEKLSPKPLISAMSNCQPTEL